MGWRISVVVIRSAYNSHWTLGYRGNLLRILILIGRIAANEITYEQGFISWRIGGLVAYLFLQYNGHQFIGRGVDIAYSIIILPT
jgi:hypothetical protein